MVVADTVVDCAVDGGVTVPDICADVVVNGANALVVDDPAVVEEVCAFVAVVPVGVGVAPVVRREAIAAVDVKT